jgi:hypothetical protein
LIVVSNRGGISGCESGKDGLLGEGWSYLTALDGEE